MNDPQKKNTVSRRQALKTIAAITGAATLTQLPTKWASPILTSGVLPAHAQTSPIPTPTTPPNTLVISNLQANPVQINNVPNGITLYPTTFTVTYVDSAGAVGPGSTFDIQLSSNTPGILPAQTTVTSGYTITGDGTNGTISLVVDLDISNIDGPINSITATVTITDNINTISNTIFETFQDLIPQ